MDDRRESDTLPGGFSSKRTKVDDELEKHWEERHGTPLSVPAPEVSKERVKEVAGILEQARKDRQGRE